MLHARIMLICMISFVGITNADTAYEIDTKTQKTIGIIIGSTRNGRTADKIYTALIESIAQIHKQNNTSHLLIKKLDLVDYDLPMLYEQTPPIQRATFDNATIKRWSDDVASCDAFIIIVPEYNGSLPGVLKNALDILYKEWNGKPVAFIAYSGGPSGGIQALEHTTAVARALQMKPCAAVVTIPAVWKLFNEKNKLADERIAKEFTALFDTLSTELVTLHSSTPMPILYKIVSPGQLNNTETHKTIRIAPEDTSFIHFSTQVQLSLIIEKYWQNKTAVVLTLDCSKLPGLLVLESNKKGGDAYYHLYNGSIPVDAIIKQHIIEPTTTV